MSFFRNTAATIPFVFLDATNGSLKSGVVGSATVNGIATTNPVVETGGGSYSVALTAAEMNSETVHLVATGSGAVPVSLIIPTTVNPLGSGDIEQAIIIEDVNGDYIADCDVWVSTDLDQTDIVAGSTETDDFGRVTFFLNAGTYYLWRDSSDYNFTNPQTITVTGTVIVTTDGVAVAAGTAASSYGSLSTAQSYFDTRLDSEAWDDASDSDKQKAIYTATRYIDRLNFAGDKTDSSQSLEFPRGGDTDVPNDIKLACYEIALCLLEGKDPEREIEQIGITSTGYGSARKSIDSSITHEHIRAGIPSFLAWEYLTPYLRDIYSIQISRI